MEDKGSQGELTHSDKGTKGKGTEMGGHIKWRRTEGGNPTDTQEIVSIKRRLGKMLDGHWNEGRRIEWGLREYHNT